MKRLLGLVAVIIVGVFGIMVGRALRASSPPAPAALAGRASGTAPPPAIDTARAAEHLAGAIRFPTVSLSSGGPIVTAAFLGLHRDLETTFPRVSASLRRELLGGLTLLSTWQGVDPTLPPVILMGPMDVVPVPEPTLAKWSHG